jgi:sugar phosphate isomerase/epimerase
MSSPDSTPNPSRRRFLAGLASLPLAATLSRAAAKPAYTLGCFTRPWADLEPEGALDAIAEAGFTVAGLMSAKGGTIVRAETPPERIRAIAAHARGRGLSVASLYAGDFLVSGDPAASADRLRRIIAHAVTCGCPTMILGGTTNPKQVDAYYETVGACCETAAASGVTLMVKPHGGTNSTGAQCRKLVERVNHRAFRLCYDPGNILYYSDGRLDPVDDAATVDGLVVAMCVKDFLPPKVVDVTPGDGRVAFPRVLARLRQGGFTSGPLIVECLARGDRAFLVAEARRARAFLGKLTAG